MTRREKTLVGVALAIPVVCGVLIVQAQLLPPGGLKSKVTAAMITSGMNGTLERFRRDMGRYPTTEEGLAVLVNKPAADESNRWAGPYAKKVADLKDAWGRELIYQCPGVHNAGSYDLLSLGPDGEIGTEDDVTNWGQTTKASGR